MIKIIEFRQHHLRLPQPLCCFLKFRSLFFKNPETQCFSFIGSLSGSGGYLWFNWQIIGTRLKNSFKTRRLKSAFEFGGPIDKSLQKVSQKLTMQSDLNTFDSWQHKLKLYPNVGPWLWCSWQGDRFRHLSSVVWIPIPIESFSNLSVNCNSVNTKIQKKRPGLARLNKETLSKRTTSRQQKDLLM